jgi:GNAT superfamily N-acetyltransferase
MKKQITVRFALSHEWQALEDLQRRASLANEHDRDALLAHPDAIELPAAQIEARQVLVAKIANSLVGFAAVLPRQDGDAELDGLFVEPDIWRIGVGRALVDASCKLAKEMGAAALHVVGNPHALGFYLACNFEVLGSSATRFGSGVLMCRQI